MLNFIKNCAISLAYCMMVLLLAWSLAVASAPTFMGASFVTLGSFTAWFAGTAVGVGALATWLKKEVPAC